MNIREYSRRDLLRKAASFSIGTGALFAATAHCSRKKFSTDASLPNIVFITADDLGWKDTGCYGNRQIRTPGIDRLAAQGARCTSAFVVSSSCSPSRASFITGQYPHTSGVTGLTHVWKCASLRPFYTTLPSMLRDAGYNTALEGKWHVSPYLPVSWYGYNERLSGMFPKDMWIKNTKKSVEFIKRNKNNRFYLEINYMHNHRDASGEFSYDPGFPVDSRKVSVPRYWTLPEWPEIREETAKFYSQTMKMDSLITEVLTALDENGLTDNTIVLFVSDNGAPFPGNKMTLYDRGTGTPLIIRWPAKIRPGVVIDDLISTIDIMPTLLKAAGLPVPEKVEGKSFYELLMGKKSTVPRDAVYMEMTRHVYYIPSRAVRTRRWKYIRNYSDAAPGLDQNNHMEWAHRLCTLPHQSWKSPRKKEELFNLTGDPNEQVNLASDKRYHKELEYMRGLLDQHMKKTGDPYLGKPFTHDYDPSIHKKHTSGEKYK